jgi:hypothetical protein
MPQGVGDANPFLAKTQREIGLKPVRMSRPGRLGSKGPEVPAGSVWIYGMTVLR